MKKLIYGLLLALVAVATVAEVYKRVDENGNTIYSDEPHPEAEVLDAGEVQTLDLPDPGPPPRLTEKPKREAAAYRSIAIASPADESTIRNTEGNFSVSISVQPALQAAFGHQLVLYLDGSAVAEPGTRASYSLTNIDRGAHKLRAAVVDANGKTVIGSDTVTVYLHRNFIRSN